MSDTSLISEADSFFIRASSFLTEPICQASYLVYRLRTPLDPTKFDNLSTRTREIALRAFICLGAFITLPVTLAVTFISGALGKVCRVIGYGLQKNNHTHIRTGTPEVEVDGPLRIMKKNCCGPAGGLHYDHGGVTSWRRRLAALVQEIKSENAHVVELEEIYDAAFAEALLRELKGEFAHAYMHMGKTTFGSVGGLMILTKCAVHSFTNTDFHNSGWNLKRGFATIEVKRRPQDTLPCARIIGTHLIDGHKEEDQIKRRDQLAQIIDDVARRTLPLPTAIVSDFNIERDSDEGARLRELVRHGYEGQEPTCTGRLVAQWYNKAAEPDEIIDNISLLRRHLPAERILQSVVDESTLQNVHLIRSFGPDYNTRESTSDHHGLGAEMVF